MIHSIVVVGAGSAGLIAAITLKKKLPELGLKVVRSPEIGVIGVGEGTTTSLPRHFFEYLKMNPKDFYQGAEPTWKLGIRFLWGPRKEFYYTFSKEYEQRLPDLSKPVGFYHDDESTWVGQISALMAHDKAFHRKQDGTPAFHRNHAFHIENKKLVSHLEAMARQLGVTVVDGTVTPEVGPVVMGGRESQGICLLRLETGEEVRADLYIDASGFRSELLGRALQEPQTNYNRSLFCDRALIGGWTRKDEVIRPYTVAETMDHGWCWQIEHEHWINRGYVYSSSFASDDAVCEEFLRKNPQVETTPRVVKFRSYRHERFWVGNVVGIGNASGFVEPLEATALQVISVQTSTLADGLVDSLCEPSPTMIDFYNRYNTTQWDDIRDFLAVHYKFNTRLETPFWQECRLSTELCGAQEVVDYYQENGPSCLLNGIIIHPTNSFGLDGYLTMLVGQKVPHQSRFVASPEERRIWRERQTACKASANSAFSVNETLQYLRKIGWMTSS